jgi:MazG family protein
MPPLREIPHPADPSNTLSAMQAFVDLVRILRADCPWDQKQTHDSISHLLIEEAYETLEAIRSGNDAEFAKELGDLLLHVVMHAVIAEQRGAFSLRDVIMFEFTKLVNRHPHIFGDERADTESKVLENWEKLKMKEGRESVLDGVPKSLPAALRAQRVQEKAANVGFDWDDQRDVWNKVREELGELEAELTAGDAAAAQREFGDLMFALVNAARHSNIVAEDALHGTVNRFMGRFRFIERAVAAQGRAMTDCTLAELDALWDEAKRSGADLSA